MARSSHRWAGLVLTFGVAFAGCASDSVPSPDGGDTDTATDPLSPVELDCKALCDATIALGCEDATCAPSCVQAHTMATDCKDELAAYIGCLAAHSAQITSCYAFPDDCEGAHDTWAKCDTGSGCGPVECKDVGSDACNCSAFCKGVKITEACTAAPGGGWDCTCAQNDQLDITCATAPSACAFFVGCCASLNP